jgi:hypothetical protein
MRPANIFRNKWSSVAKKDWPAVHAGDVWRDRDKRMDGRKVRVLLTSTDGETVTVHYQQDLGNELCGPIYRSRLDRFQRAFELVILTLK